MSKITKEEFEAIKNRAFDLLDYIAKYERLPLHFGLCRNLTYGDNHETHVAGLDSGYNFMTRLLTQEEYAGYPRQFGYAGDATEERINFLLFITTLTWKDYDTYFNVADDYFCS